MGDFHAALLHFAGKSRAFDALRARILALGELPAELELLLGQHVFDMSEAVLRPGLRLRAVGRAAQLVVEIGVSLQPRVRVQLFRDFQIAGLDSMQNIAQHALVIRIGQAVLAQEFALQPPFLALCGTLRARVFRIRTLNRAAAVQFRARS